tara:strand:- start:3923 stop:4834 length:912 start_codon:yes stop_codon:yes gene_type:complete
MAIATATALAIGSLAVSAGSAAMSFGQAGAARRQQEQAERAAQKKMAEARRKLEVNTMEDLSINKEVYDIERENVLSQAQAATQAGMEGDSRGAAATAGRVQMATQAGQRQVRAAQEQELNRIQELVAKEDSRLRDLGVQMDLQEVAGAQQKAADMEKQRAAAVQQGFQSAASAAQQGLAMVPLFSKNISAQQKAFGDLQFTPEEMQQMGNFDGLGEAGEGFTNFDAQAVADLSRRDFKAFKKGLNQDQLKMTIGSQQFQDSFERYKPKEMSNAFGMQYGAASMDPEYLKFLQYQQMMAGKTQ